MFFFAPAHAYDDNTLKALAANGFKYISDGKSCKPYKRNGIVCLPARSSGIPKMKFWRYHTAVLHAHEWVRDDKKYAWKDFLNLCNDDRVIFMSFDKYKSISMGLSLNQRLSEILYILWESKLKPLIRKVF